MIKVYIAGPDVFMPNAAEIGLSKKKLCEENGFFGLFPLDNEVSFAEPFPDKNIFTGNIAMIREADVGIFNFSPFRGISADVGTIFELGMMFALHKPVFAYTNTEKDLFQRTLEAHELHEDEIGAFRDENDLLVENFKNSDNLMLDNCLTIPLVKHDGSLENMAGFAKCLLYAKAHFNLI
jgi:nucleoside 2-deoxyribosyltransferase